MNVFTDHGDSFSTEMVNTSVEIQGEILGSFPFSSTAFSVRKGIALQFEYRLGVGELNKPLSSFTTGQERLGFCFFILS